VENMGQATAPLKTTIFHFYMNCFTLVGLLVDDWQKFPAFKVRRLSMLKQAYIWF